MLNTELGNSIKPCLYCINIDSIILRAINLSSLDALNLGMLGPKATDPVFANRLTRRRCLRKLEATTADLFSHLNHQARQSWEAGFCQTCDPSYQRLLFGI